MVSTSTTAIDLFCGAGGLSLGLHAAGIQTVLAADTWRPATETYQRNSPGVPVLDTDLSDVSGADLLAAASLDRSPDLIVGGPPCQGFSSAGARLPGDKRNDLVGVFAALIAEVRPAAFLFENVEGFLTAGRGAYVLSLLDPVIDAGYQVRIAKVNVANYGVPQLRKRVIAFGCLHHVPALPEPTHRAWGAPGVENVGGPDLPAAPTLSDALRGLPRAGRNGSTKVTDHAYSELSEEDTARIHALKPGQTMRDLPEELQHASYRRRAYRRVCDGTPTERRGGAPAGMRRLRGHEPCKAITGAASREFIHPRADRPLTLRECARIQTFPDEFVFEGSRADRAVLIGNAVPPAFAEALGRAMCATLAQEECEFERGRLLSFDPTSGSGMSPALKRTTEQVRQRFGPERQLAIGDLWD